MRKFLLAVGLLTITACGGDPTAPPRFPPVAGTYELSATFAGFPQSAAFVSGTITLSQPDRDEPGLTGTANLTAVVGGQSAVITELRAATITEAGSVSFQLGSSTSGGSWIFRGTLNGSVITGDHTLMGSGSAFSGPFTATRR